MGDGDNVNGYDLLNEEIVTSTDDDSGEGEGSEEE